MHWAVANDVACHYQTLSFHLHALQASERLVPVSLCINVPHSIQRGAMRTTAWSLLLLHRAPPPLICTRRTPAAKAGGGVKVWEALFAGANVQAGVDQSLSEALRSPDLVPLH